MGEEVAVSSRILAQDGTGGVIDVNMGLAGPGRGSVGYS